MPNVFARTTKISNAVGRSAYISNKTHKQEEVLLHEEKMVYSWQFYHEYELKHQHNSGQGLRPYNPKSVTKHKAPIGGCRSTPLWKRKKRELFSSLFSLSLRQSLGHTSVFSERDGDCLCSGRRKECCYLLPRTQHSFLHLAGSP